MQQFRSLIESSSRSPEDRLATIARAVAQYAPTFIAISAVGLLSIYFATYFGLIGEPAWQLLAIAAATVLLAVAFLPARRLLQANQVLPAVFLYMAATSLYTAALAILWQGVAIPLIIIAWMAPALGLWLGLAGRHRLYAILIGAASTLAILALDRIPPALRLQSSNVASLAALAIIAGVVVLLLAALLIGNLMRFRSLQAQLLLSFLLIISITLAISIVTFGLSSFSHERDRYQNALAATTLQDKGQITQLFGTLHADLQKLLDDQNIHSRMLYLLSTANDAVLRQSNHEIVRSALINTQSQAQASLQYSELFLLDNDGKVVVSTEIANEGIKYGDQPFFQQGRLGDFVGIASNPNFGGQALLAALRLFDADGKTVRGLIVSRAKTTALDQIVAPDPGVVGIEVYLVNESYAPITTTRWPVSLARSEAISAAIQNHVEDGRGIYYNYHGDQVIGSYAWLPDIHAALISEAPLTQVLRDSFGLIIPSIAVGFFALLIAAMAVIIISNSISAPLLALSKTAERVTGGDLGARADESRGDEIGTLARSFNTMTAQLQGQLERLEQRISDRTRDLDQQAVRLRVAAEVARDSASARGVEELMEHAAQLIRDRLNFYHTGIFLLDQERRYAVLRASPTEAGRQLIANNHRLKVGEVGIVGYVAATGESRIVLDTGTDAIYFRNPLLPLTRSEMALPLKANNIVIGVLDVQSEQPEAFTQEDISAMQAMADQLATAIDRTRLLQEVEQNLSELERAYQRYTSESWQSFTASGEVTSGYRADGSRTERTSTVPAAAQEAMTTGVAVASDSTGGAAKVLAIPIRLRGQTIGVISVQFQGNQTPADTSTMIEAAADRLAAALENSRLISQSRQRAEREHAISEVSARIGSSIDVDAIMRSTVQELGKLIGDSAVTIQLRGTGAGSNGN